MRKFIPQDQVKSSLSLWKGEVGIVQGVIERKDCPQGDLIHVIFPENDKHYGFQQSFNSSDLFLVQRASE